MKHAFRLKRIVLMLAILALGWLLPVRAAAAGGGDGWLEENGKVFFIHDGQVLRNCFAEIDGEYYYFKDDGTLLLEDETLLIRGLDGRVFWIRAGWDHVLIAGDWYTDNTVDPPESYYYREDFSAACGPTQIGDDIYLFDSETGMLLCNRKIRMNGSLWESDYEGILSPMGSFDVNGWVTDTEGNFYYYREGRPLAGSFYEIDGQYRFFHEDGRMARNESMYLDSHWIRFADDGCIVEGSANEEVNLPEPVVENQPDPVVENQPEPVVENTPEPVVENQPDPVVENTPETDEDNPPEPVIDDSVDPGEDYVPESDAEYFPETESEKQDEPNADDLPEAGEENPFEQEPDPVFDSDSEDLPSPTGEDSPPPEGWVTIGGERYFYRNGQPISAGKHYIEWQEYYFDETGRMLHDCIIDNHVLASDGTVIKNPDVDKPSESSDTGSAGPSSDDNGAESKSENTGENEPENGTKQPGENTLPQEGWVTINGERYFYRNGQPISAGRHYIAWEEYYFDETGRLLHDCIVDDHVLGPDGRVVQGGLTEVGDNQYYVNHETHKIEKNTEVNIDSTLYTTDDKGDLQKKEIPGQKSTDETKSTESGDGKTSGDSGTSEGNQGSKGNGTSDDGEEPDRDAGYTPVNEEETNRQEPAPAGGRIRYSDDYWSGDAAYSTGNYDAGRRDSEYPAAENDNPASGMLLWRDGKWTEIHGSAEKPIEIHIYGRDAAVMDRGVILRDAVLCSSEGVYGFDQFGNALPAGPAARYGKQFYITAPDPDAEILVLMMS